MDPKELEEYKQKLKGLSVKDLTDILSHINKEKVPEKFSAVEAEIADRSGAPKPAAQPPKAVAETKAPPKPAPKPKAPPEPATVKAAGPAKPAAPAKEPKPPAAAQPKEPGSMVLTVLSAIFFLAGMYFLLIPFLNIPGASAFRALFVKLPPHF